MILACSELYCDVTVMLYDYPKAAGSNPALGQFFAILFLAAVVLTALCGYRSGSL